MFCPNCGNQVSAGAKFCTNCGATISNDGVDKNTKKPQGEPKKTYYVSSKSRTISLVLAILGLFGFGGLHRFYVGKPLTGFLFLITFGGFLIGTLYDIFTIYSEAFTDGDGFPLYSDESMKPNYKRRKLKNNTVLTVFAVILSFLFLSGLMSFIAIKATHQDEQRTVGNRQNQDETSLKNGNKGEDKNKEHRHGLILDVPMTDDPIKNITETVKQNTDGLLGMIEFSDVKVDTSSGEANVLIILQGAKGFTAQGTLDEFNRVIKQEIAALYQVNPGIKISTVTVNVYMKVTYRSNGAEENLLAYKVSMDKNTASQMHWENYKSIDIMSAATDVAMHPSFRKLVNSNAGRSILDESLETLGL